MTNDEYLHQIAPKVETLTTLSMKALSLCQGIIGRSLTKEDFYVFDESGNPVISQEYDIYIGGSQPDSRSEKLLERKPVHMEVKECFMQE